MTIRRLALALLVLALILPPVTEANTSHAGWPAIDGMLLMNKQDQTRPLDARPGYDPFGGEDPSYSCDGLHKYQTCVGDVLRCLDYWLDDEPDCDRQQAIVPALRRHNELLGGHGSDRILAGPAGDVIWGDYKPSGQPTRQLDAIWGGRGRDIIYTSHGTNIVRAGGGNDLVHAHFGRGWIDCGRGRDTLWVSRKGMPGWRIKHCERISHATLGY